MAVGDPGVGHGPEDALVGSGIAFLGGAVGDPLGVDDLLQSHLPDGTHVQGALEDMAGRLSGIGLPVGL